MKSINLTLILSITFINFCWGQTPWITELPDFYRPQDMLLSSEGYIYVAAYMYEENSYYHERIMKYDLNGNFISEKLTFELPWRTLGLLENKNGEIIQCATNNDSSIIYRLNNEAEVMDSIVLPMAFNSFCLGNNEYKYLGVNIEDRNIYAIDKHNNLVRILENLPLEESMIHFIKKCSIGFLIYETDYWNRLSNYIHLDDNLEIVNDHKYNFSVWNVIEFNKGILIFSNWLNKFDEMGLVQISSELDSLWSQPFSHFYQYDGDCSRPSVMIETRDGGILMAGTMDFFNRDIIYLIKTDASGNPLWVVDSWESNAQMINQLAETPSGGFVMTQYYVDTYLTKTFLVHTNSNGTLEVNDNHINENIRVYPNPVSDMLNIEIPNNISQAYTVDVYDVGGKLVKSYNKYETLQTSINISSIPIGLYVVTINNNEKLARIIIKK